MPVTPWSRACRVCRSLWLRNADKAGGTGQNQHRAGISLNKKKKAPLYLEGGLKSQCAIGRFSLCGKSRSGAAGNSPPKKRQWHTLAEAVPRQNQVGQIKHQRIHTQTKSHYGEEFRQRGQVVLGAVKGDVIIEQVIHHGAYAITNPRSHQLPAQIQLHQYKQRGKLRRCGKPTDD